MKKKIIVIVSIVLAVEILAFAIFAISLARFMSYCEDYYRSEYSTLHISPYMCEIVFSNGFNPITPQSFCKNNGAGTTIEGDYLFAYVDEDGCLIISMRNDMIREWKSSKYNLQLLQRMLGDTRDIGIDINHAYDGDVNMTNASDFGFEISEDYTRVVSTPDDMQIYLSNFYFACIMMQMFEGKTCSEIRYEYIEFDSEGNIIRQYAYEPEDLFTGPEY